MKTKFNFVAIATMAMVPGYLFAQSQGFVVGNNSGDVTIGSGSTGLTISSSQVLDLQAADAGQGGAMTAGNQQFSGTKTFMGRVIAKDLKVADLSTFDGGLIVGGPFEIDGTMVAHVSTWTQDGPVTQYDTAGNICTVLDNTVAGGASYFYGKVSPASLGSPDGGQIGVTGVMSFDGGQAKNLAGVMQPGFLMGASALGRIVAGATNMDFVVSAASAAPTAGATRGLRILDFSLVGTNDTIFQMFTTASGYSIFLNSGGLGMIFQTDAVVPVIFSPNGTEVMRAATTGLTVGTTNATAISKSGSWSESLDFASISAGTCTDSDRTVTGIAAAGSVACACPQALEANLSCNCLPGSANHVYVRLCNVQTVGAIDPASHTYAGRWFNP